MSTSISDIPLLRESCEMATKYPEAWVNFRSLPGFLYAIECIPESMYQALVDLVPPTDWTDELFRGDIGGPPKIALPNRKLVSPTMLRYSVISRELGTYFQMHAANILEVGCGFGGQLKVIRDHYQRASAILIDTGPMLGVAKKYLETFGLRAVYVPADVFMEQTPPILLSDNALFLSNYAISECGREMQMAYITHVIKHCPRGYVRYNHHPKSKGMDSAEFAQQVEGVTGKRVTVGIEIPGSGNCVLLTWGKD